jgi:transaldolase
MELIGQILEILDHYTYPAEVLVASVRSPLHVIKAAQMGAHVATCPFTVLQQLVKHPLTDVGLERFLADWRKSQRER